MRKIKIYINYLTFFLCLLIPKKKNRWVFGAWFGNRISDNPYALFNYIQRTHPEIECIWICNDTANADCLGIKSARRNSLNAIWKCVTAKVAVMNQGYLDFGNYNWIHRSYKVQLWHGVPWKKIGEDTSDSRSGLLHKISHKTFLFSSKCDLYIAPSDETRKVLRTAFLTDDSHILSVGQPRNELLMNSSACSDARNKLKKKYGEFDKIILYMPTFRDLSTESFSFFNIENEIRPLLEDYNAILLEKQHFVQKQRIGNALTRRDRIINVENDDTQELLAASDVLITDYSSCFFDFLLTDKPIIHFLYDYEYYKHDDRGLYYDLEYVASGAVVKNKRELLDNMKNVLNDEQIDSSKRKIIRKRFDTYESPDNSKVIFDEVIKHIT